MSGEDWRGVAAAELDWDEDIPRSTHFDDIYFSRSGGIDETRHVFLAGNGLPLRWRQRDRFTIAETGFGTGLNFLTSWADWSKDPDRGRHLHYLSIEAHPPRQADLERALGSFPALASQAENLVAAYPPPLPGMHRLLFENGRVCLDLVVAPLSDALDTLLEIPDLRIDAWYLDGFAPARNPEMWTAALYRAMAALGDTGCRFATYTAAGDVRRGLESAGFTIEKSPGFGRKREMLSGILTGQSARPALRSTPWHLSAARFPEAAAGHLTGTHRRPGRALIIGAGLAGASVAEALTRHGWEAAVYDSGPVAGGASGNRQGVLYTRLSHRRSSLSEFSLHSFAYAARWYRQLFAQGRLENRRDGEFCGVLQLLGEGEPHPALLDTIATLPGFARWLEDTEAGEISGLPDCPPGLFFPTAGWLNPPAVCRALLSGAGVTVQAECGPLALARDGDGWTLLAENGEQLDTGDVAVVAAGHASPALLQVDWLRLQSIRGQTTQLPSGFGLEALRTVVCHEGYLPPAREGEHCIGATFDIDDPDPQVRERDHQANLDQLVRALPSLDTSIPGESSGLEGRAGFRCASPDYLPLAGPVPDFERFLEIYGELGRNARQQIPVAGAYVDGLYLSTGHGSRGLTSTPLTAELIAAQISGDPWPMSAETARALSPARFLIRDLIRGRL